MSHAPVQSVAECTAMPLPYAPTPPLCMLKEGIHSLVCAENYSALNTKCTITRRMVTDESVSSICFLFRMPPVIVIFHYSSSFLFVFFLVRVSSEIFLYLFRFVTSLSNVVLLIYDYFRYLRFDRLRPLQDWGNWHYVQAFYLFFLFFSSFISTSMFPMH